MKSVTAYWDQRYTLGGTSGAGSEGSEGAWKLHRLLSTADAFDVSSVIDVGCGDGQIAKPFVRISGVDSYLGIDVSTEIINRHSVSQPWSSADVSFTVGDAANVGCLDGKSADMVICLDVLFHVKSQVDHDAVVRNCLRASRRVTVFTRWTSDVLRQTKRLGSHCFYHPMESENGYDVKVEQVPGVSFKEFVVVTRQAAESKVC